MVLEGELLVAFLISSAEADFSTPRTCKNRAASAFVHRKKSPGPARKSPPDRDVRVSERDGIEGDGPTGASAASATLRIPVSFCAIQGNFGRESHDSDLHLTGSGHPGQECRAECPLPAEAAPSREYLKEHVSIADTVSDAPSTTRWGGASGESSTPVPQGSIRCLPQFLMEALRRQGQAP